MHLLPQSIENEAMLSTRHQRKLNFRRALIFVSPTEIPAQGECIAYSVYRGGLSSRIEKIIRHKKAS